MSRHRPGTKAWARAVARWERRNAGAAAPAAPLRLHVTATARLAPGAARFLHRHLLAAHALLRPALREVSLALVGDARMSDLHLRFMNVPGPTDVLTFPLDVDARGRPLAGEVVVCVPEARRRAGAAPKDVERELLLYALHGLLHLCGYDDRTGPDFRRMHLTEDMILSQLGVGPVFHPDGRPAPPAGATTSPPPLPRRGRRRGRPAHGRGGPGR